MNRLDIAAWSLILAIVLALLGVYLRGSQIDIDISFGGSPASDHFSVGPEGPIEFVFSRPVQEGLLASRIHITPEIPGEIVWNDPEHAEFAPDRPFKKDIHYSISLQSGVLGKSGEKIKTNRTWAFELRSPMVIYVVSGENGNELWIQSTSENGTPVQLTHTNGLLFDYSPAPNGEKIIYSALSHQKGINLWIIDRDGRNNHIILDCGNDFCSSGSWSPDSKQMAYNRQSAGLAPDSPRGAPRPWILDIKTGETKPLYTDSQIIGYGPLWSPDGQKIATYDGVNGRIQVYDLNQNNSTFVPSKSGITGSFSPDGQKLYFTDLIETEVGIQTQIFVADVATGLVEPISSIPGSGRYFTYDLPQWSPDGDWIAIGIQSAPDNPARQIWLVTVSGGQYQQITTDPQFTNSIYSWNDLGDGLLFQRYDLGSGKSSSETAIWWIERHQLQVISENASMARWLP